MLSGVLMHQMEFYLIMLQKCASCVKISWYHSKVTLRFMRSVLGHWDRDRNFTVLAESHWVYRKFLFLETTSVSMGSLSKKRWSLLEVTMLSDWGCLCLVVSKVVRIMAHDRDGVALGLWSWATLCWLKESCLRRAYIDSSQQTCPI